MNYHRNYNSKKPDNFLLLDFVPQLDVLQEFADVFISHAGMNSVMESMYFNVPMILKPAMGDQPEI